MFQSDVFGRRPEIICIDQLDKCAITSVIISYQATGFVVTILSIAIVIGITYIILLFVNPIYRRGSMIVTRVFAVFIAAIAIQYIVEGTKRP